MSNGPYNLGWAIQKAYTRATRHTDTLSATNPLYLALAQIADDVQRDWQDEPGIDWNSLYIQTDIGTIQQGVADYDNDSTIRKLSAREGDSIVLQQKSGINNGQCWYYDIVSPEKLTEYRYRQAAALYQGEIHFANTPQNPIFPINDARIGAHIIVPGYLYVDDLLSPNQLIQVDDPQWLVYMMAAELVRTDFVRQNQYPNLLAIANNKMQGMRQRNEDQVMEIPVDLDLFDIEPNVGLSSGGWY